jgi:hypothetical protein
MNKTFLSYLFSLVISLILIQNLSAQKHCVAHEHLQQQLKENPNLAQKRAEIEKHTEEYVRNLDKIGKNRAVVTIPVVFHIVWRTGYTNENVSDAQIQSQLTVMNNDFRKLNSDVSKTPSLFAGLAADSEVQFCLARQTPTGVATSGIVRYQSSRTSDWGTSDAVKKPASGGYAPWDATKYLNIWVCSVGGGILGYATFPGGSTAIDGVVCDYRYFGTTGTATAPFNLGRTVTHEIGHWLNLNHIWGDANCGNDAVADTPTHFTSNGGCPVFPFTNSCGGTTNTEMTMNFMDYTDDVCMYMFSTGQKNRMQALFATGGARASLLTSYGCQAPSTTCAVPTGLSSSGIGQTGATISWAAVSGATSYNVQYKTASATTWTTISAISSTSTTLSNLSTSTSYNFSVRAVCSSGTSAYSTAATFTTSAAASCGTPSGLSSSSITATGATLQWAAVTGATSYTLQYKTAATSTWTTVSGLTTTTRSITGLISSTAYNFQVAATCGTATSTYSTAANFTTIAAATCGIPTNLAAASITMSAATISWAVVTGATSYNVQYKTSSATTWTTLTGITTTNRTLTNLIAGTTYNYKIAAVCAGTTSAYSTSSSFTTIASCVDNYESNNSKNTAKTLTPGTYTALINTTSDVDWFKIVTTSTAKNIRATLTNLPANYNITLYASNGTTVLASSSNTGTTNETVKNNPTSAGTFYIKIVSGGSSQFSASACYTLTISTSATNFREIVETKPLEVKTDKAIDFSIAPNPATDDVRVEFFNENELRTDVTILDLTGRIVLTADKIINANDRILYLDTHHLPSGIYFVTAKTNGKVITHRLLINRE